MIACQPKNIVHVVWRVGLCHLGVCPHRDAAVHSVAGSSSLDWKEDLSSKWLLRSQPEQGLKWSQ